jgi:Zn-dependent metalloprotease
VIAAAEPGGPRRAIYDAKHAQGDWSTGSPPARSLVRAESDPPVGDATVDQTYDALGAFHHFFREVFGRDSWDGKGGTLEAVVHFGRKFENGFWDGRRVVLGDGGGFFGIGPTHRLDLIAKEFAMGMALKETGLRYQGESGALVQSLGCVFAIMVKQHHLGETAARSKWLIGDGLLKKGRALYDLAHPGTAYDTRELGKDPQIAHYSEFVKAKDDNGGVHTNCGIPNRAFVLAAKALGGHSWERAGQVWYDTVCGGHLSPTTTFRKFAQRTLEKARTRFAKEKNVARAIKEAWGKVGISV